MPSHLPNDDRPSPRRRKSAERYRPSIIIRLCAAAAIVAALAAVWAVVHFSQARRAEPRLIGTWRSDADATVAELRKTQQVTGEREQGLRKLFGKLKIT